jgi:hypothetical protein
MVLDKSSEPRIIESMVKEKVTESCGWLGMALIHGATLPPTLKVILGYATTLPPVEMILLVWTGLFLFLVRAIANNDKLYIYSNAIGFFFNSVMLALIVVKL